MGVSGPGLYEDDDFFIYLTGIMDSLERDIQNCFLRHEKGELTLDDVNDTLIPAMDILIALYEKYHQPVNIEENRIEGWKQAILQLVDNRIAQYGARPSYFPERRKVIEDLFTRFELICLEDN